MPRQYSYATEAIILRHSAVGETDRLVTLYSKNYGKMRAFARGVRKPHSKLSGHLEPLNQVNLLITQGRNLPLITQADMIEGFYTPSTNFETIVSGCYVADCLDAFTVEEVENQPLYSLACRQFKQVQSVANIQTQLRFFELQLLTMSGYQPEVNVCLYCRNPPERHSIYFSFEAGGILCQDCKNQFDCFGISETSTKALRYLLMATTGDAQKIRMPEAVQKELAHVLTNYLQYIIDRRLQSLLFYRRLEKWESTAVANLKTISGRKST
jgi:DNA repair protein RecO (recombination protein O)